MIVSLRHAVSPLSRRNSLRCVHLSGGSSTVTSTGVLMTPNGPLDVTTALNIVDSKASPKWPVFQLLQPNGQPSEGAELPDLNPAFAVSMYASMVRVQVLDDIMYHAQRQGRISFYMQATGEEATHIGIQLRQRDFLP